jgi:hypothetical protein
VRAARLALTLLLAASGAGAQTRPLETEEAETGAAGGLVLEAGLAAIRDAPNDLTGARRSRWDMPVLRLVHSPAAGVELDLEWSARLIAVDDPAFGTVSDWGDVALRAKWRFAPQRAGRPALAVRFGVTLPQASFRDGLGPDTLRAVVQLLGGWCGPRTALHANLGLAIQDRPGEPHAQSDFLAYGLALTRRVGSGWELLAEVAGLGVGAGEPGAERRAEARAGVRYERRRVRYDLAARRGFEDGDGTWGLTAGASWRLR